MAQLKTFNQFINEKLEISQEQKSIIKDNILPILSEYKEYFSGKSNDIKHKKVLYIVCSKESESITKAAIDNLDIPKYSISNIPLISKKIFETLLKGNNQCVIFDDCDTDSLGDYSWAMLKRISEENEQRFSLIVNPKDKKEELYFGGVVIILTATKLKESYQKFFEYFEI